MGQTYVLNEASVVAAFAQVAPFLVGAFLTGWVAAFLPAHLLRFMRGLMH